MWNKRGVKLLTSWVDFKFTKVFLNFGRNGERCGFGSDDATNIEGIGYEVSCSDPPPVSILYKRSR